jgi:hypothetical protein
LKRTAVGNKDLGEIMMIVQESIKKVDSNSGKSFLKSRKEKKKKSSRDRSMPKLNKKT